MKYIKLFLISLIVFFVLFTLMGLLFPSTIKSVKAVVINKPPKQVLESISKFENWKEWYPFFSPAENATIKHETDSAIVFSNNGKELHVTNIKTDSNNIQFSITTISGKETANQLFALPVNEAIVQTQLVWNETEHLKWYPWDRFRGLLLERTKGIYLDTALNRFKNYLEHINQQN